MTFQSRRNSANKDLRLFSALFLGVPLLFASACGGGGGSTPPVSPTITSVSVSCTSTSVQTGQTSQCTAAVSGTGQLQLRRDLVCRLRHNLKLRAVYVASHRSGFRIGYCHRHLNTGLDQIE